MSLAMLLTALLLPPPPAPPEPPAPGDVVPALLAEAGIGYEVDGDGDYRVVFSWAQESRTQMVFVSGHTEDVAGRRIREVFSPAAQLEEALDADTANALLRDSQTRKLGAWELAGDVLYYVIKLPEPLDAPLLELALSIAAETADDREIVFSGELDAL
ncbi:hypothetical protein E4582_03935 [Luteimonas yindakuii]|uniref:YbjN domain-containing protein n=1 Tax=Luteimonas yindakuii TaxID=2565782 RepID=A0A4Z1R644_9GAMM|nr:hypothetical protein [Luteimonas yindakuii]TKS54005.1 hypothetical protein E4582_03935 [Luteimonas yindakuii]